MSRNKQISAGAATIRCAIYTRKSTEEGLDQDFNSLDSETTLPSLNCQAAEPLQTIILVTDIGAGKVRLSIRHPLSVASVLDWRKQRVLWKRLTANRAEV